MKHWRIRKNSLSCEYAKKEENPESEVFLLDATCPKCLLRAYKDKRIDDVIREKAKILAKKFEYDKSFKDILKD